MKFKRVNRFTNEDNYPEDEIQPITILTTSKLAKANASLESLSVSANVFNKHHPKSFYTSHLLNESLILLLFFLHNDIIIKNK
jgi:hypothetical protein